MAQTAALVGPGGLLIANTFSKHNVMNEHKCVVCARVHGVYVCVCVPHLTNTFKLSYPIDCHNSFERHFDNTFNLSGLELLGHVGFDKIYPLRKGSTGLLVPCFHV